MPITRYYYQQEKHRIERKLTQAFKKLKKIPRKQDPTERRKIKQEIKKLVLQLEDLKFRASY
jgi:hypothetical protein